MVASCNKETTVPKRQKARQKTPARSAETPRAAQTRRQVLANLAIYGTGTLALLGGGTALALDFRRKLAEVDLARIGNGKPTIVQIHDPNCGLCRALQRETRAALKACASEPTQYLVANIQSRDGAEFADRMGLPHVTLVFLDGAGAHLHTIQGVTAADDIKSEMTRHFASA